MHACMLARIKLVHALPVPVNATHTLADSHVVGPPLEGGRDGDHVLMCPPSPTCFLPPPTRR